jgi:hypothetical protein
MTLPTNIVNGQAGHAGLHNDTNTQVNTNTTDIATLVARVPSAALLVSNNLSDVTAATARTNLGLGSSALLASSAVAQTANNLSDLANAGTARTNLGLGTAATLASSAVAQTANNLSDLASASTARANLAALGIQETVSTDAAVTTTKTIPDVTTATVFNYTLTGNTTFTMPTAAAGKSFTVKLTQDGTGSRTAAFTGVKWAGGSMPAISTGTTKTDVLSFMCIDGTNWYGFLAGLDVR